jgi:hypothetical protein
MMRNEGLPGAKESGQYRSEDAEGWKKLFQLCEGAFAKKVMGENLRDPDLARQLRPALLLQYRAVAAQRPEQRDKFMEELESGGYVVFDPNDPNDDRLWQNIKHYELERDERAAKYRKQLIEEQGVPQWMADYAGYYRFTDSLLDWLRYSLAMEMPDEVLAAAKQMETARKSLGLIYPSWGRIDHLLSTDASAEYQNAVHRAARWLEDIVDNINVTYPSSKRINAGPRDGSVDHLKAAHMADQLRIMFVEVGGDRPSQEMREQYRQKRFVEPSRRG